MKLQFITQWKVLQRQLILAGLSTAMFWSGSYPCRAESRTSYSTNHRLIAGTTTDVIDKVTLEKEEALGSGKSLGTEVGLNGENASQGLCCPTQLLKVSSGGEEVLPVKTIDLPSQGAISTGTECDTVKTILSKVRSLAKDESTACSAIGGSETSSSYEIGDTAAGNSSKGIALKPDKRECPAGQQMAFAMPSTDSAQYIDAESYEQQPIIIDNDEILEQSDNIKYEELPTDEGKTRIKTGAQFPVVVTSQVTSKTAKKGDPVQARLKYDLKIGNRLIAKKGSIVRGHLNYCLKARSVLHSLVSSERWYRNSGCLGVSFDEIINEKGEHLPLVATPARQARIVKNKGEGRELGVNHNGQVTGPWAQQLRYKALRIGLNAALAPAGVFSFGAMPMALGLIGAANPSFAFMKPVGLNVRHRRLKGFAWGFLSGIPGSWLIEDTVVKGQEAIIKPGDEFLAEFKQEFTGEPATEADLLPGASAKVRGEIVDDGKPKKKKRSSSKATRAFL